ncbi:arginase [Priestia taiwanensis]|uniref:Arginase n=1 Tax=Priestia taiwanensis TaxID=1347902 RepID=A0A917AZ39_9BACI|nr:arginase [Priestia taiwanensis]MBM7365076.1 arginase [Priestia taiwanensis]GGE83871.1 arginase [Priestia taiwanensis]
MKKNISLIGVPMDLGQTRRGVDMGPSAIRYADVTKELMQLGYTVEDLGDIEISRFEPSLEQEENLKNLVQVTDACSLLATKVDAAIQDNSFPLVLGGDHSIAIGTIAGVAKHYENLGVIWFDAHGDLNTPETTPSGNIHGMSLAINLGHGHPLLTKIHHKYPKIKPEHVVIIGARSLDEGERVFIKEHGIKVYTMHEIDRLGMSRVIDETMAYLKHTDGVHLSLDLDGLEPHDAPGVGTPVPGGITYREGHLAMEMLAASRMVTSAEFVEVNPILDERNRTAVVAVGLIASLFGQKIL